MKRNNVITGTRHIKIERRNGNLADITNFIKMTGFLRRVEPRNFKLKQRLGILRKLSTWEKSRDRRI